MAEAEQANRHGYERTVLEAEISNLRARNRETHIGQILGFLIGVVTVGCGTYAAVHGSPIAGSFIGSVGVVGLVTAFIYGRKAKSS